MKLDKRTTENIIDLMFAAIPVIFVVGFMIAMIIATIQGS